MKKAAIILFSFVISLSSFGQENYRKLADSLRYVVCLPDENFYPFGDSISERIIEQGEIIVPALIEKILDTTETKTETSYFHVQTVGDVAVTLILEIYSHYQSRNPIRNILISEFYNGIDDEITTTDSIYYKTFFSNKKKQNYKNRLRFYNRIKEWYEESKKGFKDYPPLRELQCGLWINNIGNMAYKEIGIGCELNDEGIDYAVDRYLTWTYNIPDSGCDNKSEDEFWEKCAPSLKDIVDTASFKILSRFFFMDKNFIYSYTPMACGGHLFVHYGLDRETFRVFEENTDFACDKNDCYVMSMDITNADPETFQPIIINGEPTWYSKDKNHIYDVDEPMSEAKIIELEKELGIPLRETKIKRNLSTAKTFVASEISEDSVFVFVDKMPEFPGGLMAMKDYLLNTIQLPRDMQGASWSGRVIVRFIVRKTGKISDIEIVRSIHPIFDKEVVRVIESMPDWIPAEHFGKKVNIQYTLPIHFNIQSD